ncbi:flagellin [Seleniivibrio woodruffii]|uniref:Flagellin n=1 Tax=Seleniivibrio woodruffii TaxID=1078050 RepID=A0A4R1KD07_9BACT|nr:flagellin [Seleniivibrio woodruffii]TCK62414.1 flagellin [Seleniivibrio woodruffii]TVZ34468.1 flagellin [Seleniivibrio woodruffii]
MALTVYQNIMSLNSQRHLGSSQTALATSIERLSSGLRINHAADDASGLAISEKLRGQITGLKRAAMNAQDGISMLQTAEGALEEVSSMLQRMRELAVQASNGVYTSNDRIEIQKEVEQLKGEIDRISSATEFNTKKLLNGDGTALWSASSSKIKAIIRDEVDEGNYRINLETIPGSNEIYKTDIMTLKDGAIGSEIVDGTNDTNIGSVNNASQLASTGTSYYTVTVGDLTAAQSATISLTGSYLQTGSSFSVAAAGYSNSAATSSGYIEVVFEDNVSANGTTSAQIRYIDALTGYISEWEEVDVTALNGTVSLTAADTTNLMNSAGQSLGFDLQLSLGVNGKIQNGDKVLLSFSGANAAPAGSVASSGGGTVQISGGPTGQAGPTLKFTSPSSLTAKDNGDNFVDTQAKTVYYASINAQTGNVDFGNMTINFKENNNATESNGETVLGDLSLKISGSGEAAATTTKLKDIAVFEDSDGNNLFSNKQELTVWGNGTSAVIYLEADDTIADFETKLTDAIVNKLGMGSTNNNVNSHLVDYVSIPTTSGGIQSVAGTFIIQTALTGEQGQVAFSGDEELINGLSLNKIQSAVNNTTKVTVYDAHSGQLVGTDETGNDRVFGIIGGVEIALDSRAGVTESWDTSKNQVIFSTNSAAAKEDYFLHIVDNSTDLQIGANSGQTLAVSIPQLDVTGLGLNNITLVSQDLAQAAIPDIDAAISQVVSVRATIGAQVNRLEHTIANLQTAEENMTAAESRIRDLDMAEEMSTFTRYQMLGQAGVSMLAQANQIPQMALQLLQ